MSEVGKSQIAGCFDSVDALSREEALTEVRRLIAEGLAFGDAKSFASEQDFLTEIERLVISD
jgi:hypothetical protein